MIGRDHGVIIFHFSYFTGYIYNLKFLGSYASKQIIVCVLNKMTINVETLDVQIRFCVEVSFIKGPNAPFYY